MKALRVRWLCLMMLAIVGLFLVACSDSEGGTSDDPEENASQETEGGSSSESASGELSGEVEFMTISLLPAFEDYLNNLKDEFESMHPDVTVTINDVPYDQVSQVVLTQASSGSLPDVMNLNTEFVKKVAANGALVNMDEAADDVKDDFFEGLWKTAEVDGNVYALPWYTTTSGLIYNPDILAEAGFEEPPSTFEEAWEMSQVIYEETGKYGQVVGPEMHLLFPKNGIPILNEDGTEAAFNTPEAAELWGNLKEYYDEGLYNLDVMLNQVSMAELYAQEQVAWWSTGPQLYRQVEDLSPEVYEKSLGAPAFNGKAGLQHANPMNIAVAANSDAKEAAIEFAKFVTNAENQVEFSKEASVLPPLKEAIEDPFFEEGKDSEDATIRSRYYAAQALADAENMSPPGDDVLEVIEQVQQAFQRVILEDVDPAEALADAEQQVNNILAQ
ncbi:ABC transporter substrate-binding protein [Tenuibacillus multivorans]|uniref:Putative chitobiose transport system substrate-binding protein n=1 Tax=Tenuibacillus multivorans TaxID=237069 RepID=A0A1H0BRE6_9BACI|nr:sugar ABC transporter substrate-binding protein [Tenuibacillus multivorans]GEL77064.1 sugar ABC transporter substrate-binding protein [Tenuibacillus multivorans]SDN48155.1 putative chitobiose transport system substrate-binding protein [Tenuibacillus multivorans]